MNTIVANVIFPGRPQALKRARHARRGQVFTPKESQLAKKTLAWQLKAACPKLRCDDKTRFGIQLELYSDRSRMADGDNYEKLLLDAFTGVIWKDDEQVDEMQWKRIRGALEPRTHFICYRIGATA